VEDPLAAFLLALQLLPAVLDARGRLGHVITEDVGMARNELRVNPARSGFQISCSPLLQQQREKVRLEQEIADLVEELRVVARECGVCNLVGLFDGVRDDRAGGLLAVPRTFAAQALGQLLELDERVCERHRVNRWTWSSSS